MSVIVRDPAEIPKNINRANGLQDKGARGEENTNVNISSNNSNGNNPNVNNANVNNNNNSNNNVPLSPCMQGDSHRQDRSKWTNVQRANSASAYHPHINQRFWDQQNEHQNQRMAELQGRNQILHYESSLPNNAKAKLATVKAVGNGLDELDDEFKKKNVRTFNVLNNAAVLDKCRKTSFDEEYPTQKVKGEQEVPKERLQSSVYNQQIPVECLQPAHPQKEAGGKQELPTIPETMPPEMAQERITEANQQQERKAQEMVTPEMIVQGHQPIQQQQQANVPQMQHPQQTQQQQIQQQQQMQQQQMQQQQIQQQQQMQQQQQPIMEQPNVPIPMQYSPPCQIPNVGQPIQVFPFGYRTPNPNYGYQPMYAMDPNNMLHGQSAHTTMVQNNIPNEQAAVKQAYAEMAQPCQQMMDPGAMDLGSMTQAHGEPHVHAHAQQPGAYFNPQHMPQQQGY